ncbi:hypothetical protein ACO0J1_16365 [Stenotrophomonas acidaminiphila]|jgi:hypothetical protein|uniref:hypothetical protein n=1 Tax=Stenotrophomonas acidaminiphila TaxID=128780 RepID=UPI0015F5C10F|nr:hypothetical protein [Stenotrophomonas acidaminiphila]
MKKFNKSLLTAAVVGALALPALASAASLAYPTGKQIWFAKDLIVNNGTTINTPSELTLSATIDDATRIGTVASDNVTVKVTLTNGAKFDATADAKTLVENFKIGSELGGTGAIIGAALVGTPYYSASGQELNFTFTAPGAGADLTGAGDYALQLNSVQITNLVQGLFDGNTVGAEITVQNSVGQQILASKATIARSKWGLVTESVASVETTKKIDVGSTPDPKTWFAANGQVGGSGNNGATPGSDFFHLGGITIDVAEAPLIGTGDGYVNNYSAVAANPEYNVVSTAEFKIKLNGLAAYGNNIKFSTSNTCSAPVGTSAPAADGSITVTLPASSPLLANVTNASPSPSTLHVCAFATGAYELAKVDQITGEVTVDYNLSTQRVNPVLDPAQFGAIDFNGTTLIFQNVNPGGNATAQSMLRLTNNNATSCAVEIDAKDDAGLHSDSAKITLGAHKSVQLYGEDLEGGNAGKGLTGGFGDGTGKWYVRVTAQCTNFKASALNRNVNTGTVTDLTAEKWNGSEWNTPATKLNP